MKTVLLIALLAGVGYLGYKYIYKKGDTATKPSGDTTSQFMASCRKASAKLAKPDEYCECLSKGGITSMMSLATNPDNRKIVSKCQEQFGR